MLDIISATKRVRHSTETFEATPIELTRSIMSTVGWQMTQEDLSGYAEQESAIQSEPSKFDDLLGRATAGLQIRNNLNQTAAQNVRQLAELCQTVIQRDVENEGLNHTMAALNEAISQRDYRIVSINQ